MRRLLAFALVLAPGLALAVEIDLPGGTLTASSESPADSVRLPVAPWSPDSQPPQREGAIRKRAFSVSDPARTTLQLVAPARAVLEEAGYEQVFACADAACGGFDFRFQLDLLPEPAMHVDLGDFRYVLMENEDAEPSAVSLVSSSSATAGFLHVTEVFPADLPPAPAAGTAEAGPAAAQTAPDGMTRPPPDLAERLVSTGRAVLDDLDFATGSAELGPGPYDTLAALAAWLAAEPGARVVLVGHTDAIGSLADNTSLSRRRAEAVLGRLTTVHGADPAQLQSAGAGYLAPVAPNLTDEGRAENRRVEAVLLSR